MIFRLPLLKRPSSRSATQLPALLLRERLKVQKQTTGGRSEVLAMIAVLQKVFFISSDATLNGAQYAAGNPTIASASMVKLLLNFVLHPTGLDVG